MNYKSIVLIGFMGVGKTTIGRELARKLQWTFIDVDAEIEKIYDMSTVDIFRIYGEDRFRQKEKEVILEAANKKNQIISVGGGAFKQSEVKEVCMKQTTVVFLDLAWDYWKNRVSFLVDTRPILQGKTLTEMKELYDQRQAIYEDHHLHILLEERDIQTIAKEIIAHIKII